MSPRSQKEYEVEEIVGRKWNEDTKSYYFLIKWKGFSRYVVFKAALRHSYPYFKFLFLIQTIRLPFGFTTFK
jgi:hypothetical protein